MAARFASVVPLTLILAATAAFALAPPPLEPAASGGLETVDRALAKLSVHKRLLLVAAHPDDEDTQLLALVARQMGGEAAYLSLSRGEGGQNFIGPELGVGLGLIRTGELVAARRVDGARQYFSRAFDFGYTRSLEETLERWPKEALVEDVARIVRRFRPQVMVSTFTPEFGGHGQHVAAGVAAFEAFELAGRDDALPGLAAEGLPPWEPATLYRSTWFDREATTLTLATGGLDPFTGRSIHQLAMESRSLHRSQNMGRLQDIGRRETRLGWVRGGAGPEADDLFAGVDTRLRALAAPLADAALRATVEERLERVERLARAARERLTPGDLARAVPALAETLALLDDCRELLGGPGAGPARAVDELLAEKQAAARAGLLAAAGVVVDAAAEAERWVPGDELGATVEVWNAGPLAVGVEAVALRLPAAPSARSGGGAPSLPVDLATDELVAWRGTVPLPAELAPSIPYFLERPLVGDLYDWSRASPEMRGEPYGPPPVVAEVWLRIAGHRVRVEREVVHRQRDPGRGEVRRPLQIVAPLEVRVHPPLAVRPLADARPRLVVEVRSNVDTPVSGRVRASGWAAAVEPAPFHIAEPRGRAHVAMALPRPAAASPARHTVHVEAEADGHLARSAATPVSYEHIRPVLAPREAEADIVLADLAWPDLGRVGYVRGASDTVPEALEAAGLPVEVLDAEALRVGELDGFDAILVGPRAYEVEPTLAEANGRLLDYVHRGGLLLVQYQQYPYVQGGFAPHPFTIDRPHDRVTDPQASVRPLAPAGPLLRRPNRLDEDDWAGWVQERGLYFAASWDEAYTPLLAMPDHQGRELRGGLLVATHGEGTFIYTGLALFRQLPAGVPGAYRLLANLLSLGHAEAR